jgi:hypothetical protein
LPAGVGLPVFFKLGMAQLMHDSISPVDELQRRDAAM